MMYLEFLVGISTIFKKVYGAFAVMFRGKRPVFREKIKKKSHEIFNKNQSTRVFECPPIPPWGGGKATRLKMLK